MSVRGTVAARARREREREALREDFEERAAILEHDAGMTREEAEREAGRQVYGSERAS